MINDKIFAHGATSITVEVAEWKANKTTPAKYRCKIEHPSHSPSAVVAVRDSAVAAEREATESFLSTFKAGSGDRVHAGTKSFRISKDIPPPAEAEAELPKAKPAAKVDDDFEY